MREICKYLSDSEDEECFHTESASSITSLDQPEHQSQYFSTWEETSVNGEYKYLNHEQMQITTKYMNGQHIAQIARDLQQDNIKLSEHSIKTCVLRTILGFKREYQQMGGNKTCVLLP